MIVNVRKACAELAVALNTRVTSVNLSEDRFRHVVNCAMISSNKALENNSVKEIKAFLKQRLGLVRHVIVNYQAGDKNTIINIGFEIA